jgi:hypothetical protein
LFIPTIGHSAGTPRVLFILLRRSSSSSLFGLLQIESGGGWIDRALEVGQTWCCVNQALSNKQSKAKQSKTNKGKNKKKKGMRKNEKKSSNKD